MKERKTYVRDSRSPTPKSAVTSRIMSAVRAENTKPELLLRKALWAAGQKGFRLHWKKAPGRPDIAFPGKRVAIFVNGCYWHRCPKCQPHEPKTNSVFWRTKFQNNVARDARKDQELTMAGWCVVVIWECEIKDDVNGCVDRVKLMLNDAH